jgi:hypothetical protein
MDLKKFLTKDPGMQIRPLKIATFLLCLLPVLILGWRATDAGLEQIRLNSSRTRPVIGLCGFFSSRWQ